MTNLNMAQLNHTATQMTSLEIAELCSKQHAHVCRDIQKLNAVYEKLGLSKIGEGSYTHKNTGSQQHRMFLLNKAQSLDLVTGYKPELRILVNRRWQELEDRTSLDLNNPEHLRNLLIGYTEKVTHLQEQVKTLALKADGLDRLASAKNLISIRDASKSLKIGQKKLTECLIEKKVVFRGEGNDRLQAYQKSIDQKLVAVVMSKPKETKDGYKSFPQVKLTQKLITRIAAWLEKQNQEVVAA